jgi:8-oxo-dGTP pyrophosphatase MutT (NUDIX family)
MKRIFGEDQSYIKGYQLDNGYQFISRKAKPFVSGNDDVDAVVVLAYDQYGKMLIIKEHRPVVGSDLWALPAGLVDKNETIAQAAVREVKEETGMLLSVHLTFPNNFSCPGLTDEKVAIVRGTVYGKLSSDNLDKDERITPYLMSTQDMMNNNLFKNYTPMQIWLRLVLMGNFIK